MKLKPYTNYRDARVEHFYPFYQNGEETNHMHH